MFNRLLTNSKKNIFYPKKLEEYENFFKSEYINDWVENPCLCHKSTNDILLSKFDRHNVDFTTVICKNCGLIRAKKYLNNSSLTDFYKNHYRRLTKTILPAEKFLQQFQTSKRKGRYKLIEKYLSLKNKIIFDIGGACGGVLSKYIESNETYLFDYDDNYLSFAKSKGIKTLKGGLEEALREEKKPDLIILSHVIEHWNNFEDELKKLNNLADKNTFIYLETPGIDSLKKGRRNSDILGDLQVAHKYYFSSKVLKNILIKYNFKVLYIDSEIRVICKKNDSINEYSLKNNYINTIIDLYLAEIRRYLSIQKSKIFKKNEFNK
ncbi:class I SAM-dependent methyltransferase [Candidatus Pelagibacter ubique]|nr:class I SAM-dependent methyltransferase [Candidatus Pelagibacter ubique]